MFEDLSFYFENHLHLIPSLDSAFVTSVFAKKIVASHYMQLVAYVRAIISNREWLLAWQRSVEGFEINWVEEQWSVLQGLSRRCSEYCEDLESILLGLGMPLTDPDPSLPAPWSESARDFQYLYMRLKFLKSRALALADSIAGLASMAGNRQSLAEAARSQKVAQRSLLETKNARTLTLIGLVFIPLAYTSGLFSMTDGYIPGGEHFRIYFAVSVPMIFTVFCLAVILELGYNEDAAWSWITFKRSLKSHLQWNVPR